MKKLEFWQFMIWKKTEASFLQHKKCQILTWNIPPWKCRIQWDRTPQSSSVCSEGTRDVSLWPFGCWENGLIGWLQRSSKISTDSILSSIFSAPIIRLYSIFVTKNFNTLRYSLAEKPITEIVIQITSLIQFCPPKLLWPSWNIIITRKTFNPLFLHF